jgi:hypothetical protein
MIRVLLLAVAVTLAGSSVHAHHSIAAIYDSSDRVRFDAVVVDFQFVNPHPFVVVERAGQNGRTEQWRLELDNLFELSGAGMTGSTLRKGDRISVSGGRARDQSRALYVRRLDRAADGFWYEQVGSRPRTSLK